MAIQTKTMTVKSDTALAETTTTIRDTVTFDVSKMPNGITYKGLKAVLSFADPIKWNKASTYDSLTVVWDDATHASYASKRPVPQNIELTNEFYWIRTADLDAQVEMYRQEVQQFDGRITANAQAIAAETARAIEVEKGLQDKLKYAGIYPKDSFDDHDILVNYGTNDANNIVVPSNKEFINIGTLNSTGICFIFGGNNAKITNIGTVNADIGISLGKIANNDSNIVDNSGNFSCKSICINFEDNYYSQYNKFYNGVFHSNKVCVKANAATSFANNNVFSNTWFSCDGTNNVMLISSGTGEVTDNIFTDCSFEPPSTGEVTDCAIFLKKAIRNVFNNIRIEENSNNKLFNMEDDVNRTYIKTSKRMPISSLEFDNIKAYPGVNIDAPIIDKGGYPICNSLEIITQYFNNVGTIKMFRIKDYNPSDMLYVYNTTSTPINATISNNKRGGNNVPPGANVIFFENNNAKDTASLNNFYGINGIGVIHVICNSTKGCKVTDFLDKTVLNIDAPGKYMCIATLNGNDPTAEPIWRSYKING